LIAAVLAAKIAKYLRSILIEFGFPPSGTTLFYEDDKATTTFKMVNAKRPTERSGHIDIQHFAIQEWRQRGDIKLAHIPGVINDNHGPAPAIKLPAAFDEDVSLQENIPLAERRMLTTSISVNKTCNTDIVALDHVNNDQEDGSMLDYHDLAIMLQADLHAQHIKR
jgi:hypothetical protein